MKLSDLLKTPELLKQDKPVLVNANINAVNDQVYNNIANATYTDPTGVAGRGYTVNVVAGTATVGAVAYSVAGTRLLRMFDGTVWSTQVLSGTNTGDETLTRIRNLTGATDWIDYSGTSTVVGWSTLTENTIWYKKLDANTLLVHFRVSGTSNANNATFTIPFTARSGLGNQIQGATRVTNNGVSRLGDFLLAENSNVVEVRPFSTTNEIAVFGTSGTKSIFGMITLAINS